MRTKRVAIPYGIFGQVARDMRISRQAVRQAYLRGNAEVIERVAEKIERTRAARQEATRRLANAVAGH